MRHSNFRFAPWLVATLAVLRAGPLSAQPAFVRLHGPLCQAFPGTTGGSYNLPFTASVPAGHTLVLSVGVIGTAVFSSIGDTQANGWQSLSSTTPLTPHTEMDGTSVSTPLTVADHVTIAFSSNTAGSAFGAILAEYSGVASLPGGFDQESHQVGTSTSSVIPLVSSTAQASELLVGTTTMGADPGSTTALLGYLGAGAAICTTYFMSQDYDVVSSTGFYSYGLNFTNSIPWGTAFVALKAAAVPVGLQRFGAE